MGHVVKVSIYTQVYNTKPYLRQCIESVLNQTYPNFEYIIIDNGSTDGSSDLLNEYAQKDPRIQLIRTEENKGAMFWLEILEKEGTGEYMAALDSDDWIEKDFLEKLLLFAEENGLDIACTGSRTNDESSVKTGTLWEVAQPKIFTKNQFADGWREYVSAFCTWWGKLVRMELVRGIERRPKYMGSGLWIDVLYCHAWLRNAQRIGLDASVLHHYRVRSESMTHGAYDPDRFNACVYMVHELTAFLEEMRPMLPENQNHLDNVLTGEICVVSELIMKSSLPLPDKLKEIQRMVEHPATKEMLRRSEEGAIVASKWLFLAAISERIPIQEKAQESFSSFVCAFIQVVSPNCAFVVTPRNTGLFLEDRSWLRARIGDDMLQRFYIEHHRTFFLLFGSRSPLRFFPGNATPLLQSIIQDDPKELLRRLKQLARKKHLAEQYDLKEIIGELQAI